MDKQTTTIISEEKPGFLSKALKIAAFPLAAISGYWFVNTSIRNSTYDRLSRRGFFGDISGAQNGGNHGASKTEPLKELKGVVGEMDAAFETARAEYKAGRAVKLAETIPPIDRKLSREIKGVLRKAGVGNIFKQWGFAHESHKQRALMDGFTAAGITLGAMFAIANTKTIARILTRHEKENEPDQGPSL